MGIRPGWAAGVVASAGSDPVVLLAPDGRAIGTADKATVHGARTPYHLAFSCYAFDEADRLLVTRRAETKRTWPGVWTNTCCGHPRPGEPVAAAVHRHLLAELGLTARHLRLALPTFSYRAHDGRREEHELCPVYLARITADPDPDPEEVAQHAWLPWGEFVARARDLRATISPWARLQVQRLVADELVDRYLRDSGPRRSGADCRS